MDYVSYQRAKWEAARRKTGRQVHARPLATGGFGDAIRDLVSGGVSADPVAEFLKWKKKFYDERGLGGSYETGGGYPATTWKDVYAFGMVYYNEARKISEGDWTVKPYSTTSSFERATDAWLATFPLRKLVETAGPATAPAKLVMLLNSRAGDEPYPWNREFWWTGKTYSISRSAFGSLPTKLDLAVESVEEAWNELPDTLRGLLPSWPNLGAGLPNFGLIGDMMKWSMYGGAALLLWWVLKKPKKGAA